MHHLPQLSKLTSCNSNDHFNFNTFFSTGGKKTMKQNNVAYTSEETLL